MPPIFDQPVFDHRIPGPPMPHGLVEHMFGIEMIYSLFVIIVCMFIYLRTKEIFGLTGHRGIKYFRDTFLFFAIAYLFRLFSNIFMVSTRILDYHVPGEFWQIGMPLIAYASSMAILLLTYSTIYKKFRIKNPELYLNLIAIAIVLFVTITRSQWILMISQVALLIFAVLMSYINHSKAEKKTHFTKLHVIYSLLFIFWILNLVADARRTFHVGRLPIELISIALFLFIAYKVSTSSK